MWSDNEKAADRYSFGTMYRRCDAFPDPRPKSADRCGYGSLLT